MKAYKGFNKNLTCIGYQFSKDALNKTKQANCRQNGFHCAENPLDCLSYYPNWDNAVYYMVEAEGDLDEDEMDSKISCTEITLVKKLNLQEFVSESVQFIQKRPFRPFNTRSGKIKVCYDDGRAACNNAVIVRGKNPRAAGEKGAVIALLKEEKETVRVEETLVIVIDGTEIKEDIWYTIAGGQAKEVRE